jgi:hypothetical protein
MPVPEEDEIKECMISTAGMSFATGSVGAEEGANYSDLDLERLVEGLRRTRKWCRGLFLSTHVRGKSRAEVLDTFEELRNRVENPQDIAQPLRDDVIEDFQKEGVNQFLNDDTKQRPNTDVPDVPRNLRAALRNVDSPEEAERLRTQVSQEGAENIDPEDFAGDTDEIQEAQVLEVAENDTDEGNNGQEEEEDLDTTQRGDATLGNFGN